MGFPHSVITTSLKWAHHYPHFTDDETGALGKEALGQGNPAKVQTHIHFPEPHIFSPQTREEGSGFGG